ncbi:MAG: hypothetical protein HC851_13710 [Acaryochloris sp. RU_4_1]|nr:hypothetical protein [Acaryochloris sp. RU_4_1]NJR55382.1 hypothetical protein [Acaryochloris sp. CRU_2_0]
MTWTAYQVVFKLKSPMHIGCGKVGNVQRTRPYVTGRVFWGALTMRLTRDATSGSATNSSQYKVFGDQVDSQLAYTYFYPTTDPGGLIEWPWGENENLFRRRFLSSYTSTALVYPQQAADEGLLHEVEFLSPRTLDEGKHVYLIGYVFEKENCTLNWQDACQGLQFGGERGYGWGDVKCVEIKPLEKHDDKYDLFDGQADLIDNQDQPIIQAERLLAHASSTGITATGEIEPMVGREWRSHNPTNRYAGQHIENFDDLCWVPGSIVQQSDFTIKEFGIWEKPITP